VRCHVHREHDSQSETISGSSVDLHKELVLKALARTTKGIYGERESSGK
jgi:hypothetical protein